MTSTFIKTFCTIALLITSLSPVSSLAVTNKIGGVSYYSDFLHGKPMASGKMYDKNKLTAAHKKLAFGTKVRVTDLQNNKSVVVTITDRGPFIKGRIIDLSLAAAKKIDLVKKGVSKIKLEILK